MPLGTEVGLGPGDIVLHRDPAGKGHSSPSPLFGPCLLWPNGRPSQQLLNACFTMTTIHTAYVNMTAQCICINADMTDTLKITKKN